MKKTRLTKKEALAILSVQQRLDTLADKYDGGNDIPLQIAGNGTVHDQLDCAIAALETIIQEYDEIFSNEKVMT